MYRRIVIVLCAAVVLAVAASLLNSRRETAPFGFETPVVRDSVVSNVEQPAAAPVTDSASVDCPAAPEAGDVSSPAEASVSMPVQSAVDTELTDAMSTSADPVVLPSTPVVHEVASDETEEPGTAEPVTATPRPMTAELTPLFDVTIEEQRLADAEANAFRLRDVINTSRVDYEMGDGSQQTGVAPLTAEDRAAMRRDSRALQEVHLNKIGLARLNAERTKKGLQPLVAGRDVHVAPMGKDHVTVRGRERETALPAPGAAMPGAGAVEIAAPAAELDGDSGAGARSSEESGGELPAPGALPAAVDNSTLQYFPPIRDQSGNSCAQWAGIYYVMTHETAMLRGWDAKTGGDDYRFTPTFTYNFVNNGQNIGSQSWDGWAIAAVHGVPRRSQFHASSNQEWCVNPDHYQSALADRIEDGYTTIYDVDTQAGMDALKGHLANGHTAVSYTYIGSWKYMTTADDPGTTDDDAYVGKPIAYKIEGNRTAHAMTVVGYNDDIWCDINTNGVVESNEKGAYRIANSWGGNWKDGGYCWVAYDGITTPNTVDDWDGNRYGIFQYNDVWFASPRVSAHVPEVVARVTLNHNKRDQVYMKAGLGEPPPRTATRFTDFQAVEADGQGIGLTGWRVPRAVDWDGDGDQDLLIGHQSGIWRYENTGTSNAHAFAAGVLVQAGGSDISLSGNILITLADMTGDGVDDLVAVAGDKTVRVYENTSAAGAVPVYAAATQVASSEGGNFVLPDQRFDAADWDGDGLVDLVTGTWDSDCYLYLNVGTASSPEYDPAGYVVIDSGTYQLYPRVIDFNGNGDADYVRAVNWGAIRYWYDPPVTNDLGSEDGIFVVTDTEGADVALKPLFDGAMPDFADINGDGVFDLLLGGHIAATSGMYVAYGVPDALSLGIQQKILVNQGGTYAFSGAAAASEDFTYCIDLTDVAPTNGTSSRWVVQATDSGMGDGDLTIKKVELFDVSDGSNRLVGISTMTPVVANGDVQHAWVEWTMGEEVPVVDATAADASAAEEGQDPGTWTLTRDALTNESLTVYYGLSGTATEGLDYSVVSTRSVSFSPGQTEIVVTLTPLDDGEADEPVETAILTLVPGAGYVYADPDGGAISIADNDYVAPSVTNLGATSLTKTSANVLGSTSAGRDVQVWICWGTIDGGTNSIGDWANVAPVGLVTQGVAFEVTLDGLSTNRTYWYRCVASNTVGMGWATSATPFSGKPVGGSSSGGGPVAGADIYLDAGLDDGANAIWEDSLGIWDLTMDTANGVTYLADAGSVLSGIAAAYNFPGGVSGAGGGEGTSFGSMGGWDTEAVSIEIWFKPNATNDDGRTNGQVLWETGGGTGLGVFYNDGTVEVGHDTTEVISSVDVSGIADEFIQVVLIYDVTGTDDFELYINGAHAASGNRGDSDWSGTDGAGLGARGGSNVGGRGDNDANTESFEGQLAIFRAYRNQILDADDVAQNYNSLASAPEALGNLAPTGVSGALATLNAVLQAPGTNYDVYVYYGTSDGGTNVGAWEVGGVCEYVGSWADVSTNVSYTASGLIGGTTYHYTFMASNAAGVAWASPSWAFTTLGTVSQPLVTTNHSVPHTWLTANVPDSTNGFEAAVLDDPDGDGFATWQEYWSGTDPTNAASHLKIGTVVYDGGQITIRWEHSNVDAGIPPVTILGCTDLSSGTWSNLGTRTPVNGTNSWSITPAGMKFYRLGVEIP